MHYDVEGNLDINIKDFEEHINQAREKLEEFEKNFKQLAEIKSSNQMETLIESVQKIRSDLKEAGRTTESLTSKTEELKSELKGTASETEKLNDKVDKTEEKFKEVKKEVKVVSEEVTTLDNVINKTEKSTERLEKNFKDLSAPLFVLEDAFNKISKNTMIDVLSEKLEKAKARMETLRKSIKEGVKSLVDIPDYKSNNPRTNMDYLLKRISEQKKLIDEVDPSKRWGFQQGLGQLQRQLREKKQDVIGQLDELHIREMSKEFAELKEESKRLEKELGKLGEKADTTGAQFDGATHKFESRFGQLVPKLQEVSNKSTETLNRIPEKTKSIAESIKESFTSINPIVAKSTNELVENTSKSFNQLDEQVISKMDKIKRRMRELSDSMILSKSKINSENTGYGGYSYNLNKIKKMERFAYYDFEKDNLVELQRINAGKKALIDEEISNYKKAREEMKSLKQEYNSLVSSTPSSVENMVGTLKHLQTQSEETGNKIIGLRKKLDNLFDKRNSQDILSAEWDKTNAEIKNVDKLLQKEVQEFNNYRSEINNILKSLVNDYNLSFKEIESIMNTPLKANGLMGSLEDIERQISNKHSELYRMEKLVHDLEFKYSLNQSTMVDKADFISKHGKRRKDGQLMDNSRNRRWIRDIEQLQEENEKILTGKYDGIPGYSNTNLQKAREGVIKLKEELNGLKQIQTELLTSSNFGEGAEVVLTHLEQKLETLKGKIKESVDFIREQQEAIRLGADSSGVSRDLKEAGLETLKERMVQFKELKEQISIVAKGISGEFDKSFEKVEEKSKETIDVQKNNLEILLEKYQEVAARVREINTNASKNPLQWSSEMKQIIPILEEIHAQFQQIESVEAQNLGKNILETIKLIEKELAKVSLRYDKIVELDMTYKKASGVGSVHNIHNFGVDFKDMQRKANDYFNNLAKPAQEGLSRFTNMWVHEQITQFNEFARAVQKAHDPVQVLTTDFSKLKTSASTNTWVHDQINQFNEFAKAVQKAHEPVMVLTTDFSKLRTSASTNVWVHEQIVQFNEFARAVQKAHEPLQILTTDFSKLRTSASTNVWVHEQITQFNEFARAVQESSQKAMAGVERLNKTFAEMKSFNLSSSIKNTTGVLSMFDPKTSTIYSRNAELASRSTYKLEESLTSMASASDTAGSRVSTLGGILRTLRTTLSMIGGMFVWDFAFQILDATKATISAKSEMESFFTTLKWGTKDINTFNASLDRTIKKFPKMNKFQLGETIASLGVEFNLSAEEMEQIGNVAPMIVNEYLRAGRKTEEAILAIKDISQGEFLRLSRETGVGKEELKAAGWNGDNKDILNLYQALEKVGKSRHWDSFASKATSINDVMMITENRMTEFATMISDWFTPVIVNGFNLLGDTFEGSRKWLENLSPLNKSLVSVTGAIVGFSTAAWGMHSKVVPALKNVGSTILSNVLGVDKAIIQTYGLSSAIAQQTIVEKARNIAFKEGNLILDQKIRKGIAEAEASKLGMEATELQTVYEKMYADTLKVTRGEMALADAETKSRKLTQEALLLAEKECITVEEAHALIMEREKIANMGTLKSIIAYKLGLDMSIASQSGLATAIGVKLGVMTVEETETGILTTLNWGLVASYIALLAPLALVAAAIVLLVADFMDLCASYDDFNDRLVNGKDRIDELDKKYKAYHKTAQEVEQKQKEGKATQEELTRAREEEKWALINLEKAQSDYNRSLQVSNYFQKTTDESSAKRIESTKKQLEELAKKQGLPSNYYLKDYNQELTRAEQATYDATQNLGWRTEQFEKDIKKISDPKLVKQFKSATDAYEEAKYKIDAPDSDMMDRVFGHIEAWSIGLEIESIKFQNDPDTWFREFAKNNAPTFDVIGEMFRNMPISATSIANIIIKDRFKKVWEEVTASFTSWSIPTNQWLNSLLPDLSVDDFKSWFGTHVREPLQQFFSNPFGSGDVPMGNKTFDISDLLKVSAEGIAKIGDELWSALDQYLSNHVPMYGWIKQIMPKEEATAQGQQTGNGLFEGFKTGISPVDNLIQTAGNTWSSLSFLNGQKVKNNTGTGLNGIKTTVKSHLDKVSAALSSSGNQWGTSAHTSGGKIKTGVKDGSQGMDSPVKSEISDISSSLQGAGGSWFSMALASAKQIVGGIIKGLNRKSPGDGAKTVLQEMIDAGNFIAQQSPMLYAQSQQAGQSIVRGMQDMNLGQQLANTYNTMSGASNNVIGLNQATMNNTIGTYNYLSSKVNSTFGSIDDTITTTDDSINKSFNAMNLSATKSFTDMSLNATSTMQNTVTSNQMHLNSMQSSTLSTTKAMVSAWNSMKNHIVSSAKYIQSTSYSRFSSLHRSISSFYNQLANAHFSAGLPTGNSSLSRGRNLIIGRNRNTGGRIKAKSSKRIGNVYGSKDKGLRQAHIDRIKNTSNSWEIGDPWFLGIRIPMNNHVRDFDNGKTVRVNTGNFESILRDILTARGFGNPNTYQYYANSRRSNQQVWDDVRCNCYDGAELIVEIGQMLGLSGHLVHGSWKGEGHMGAMVGGKLYDMTQFQKRGVFRGTSGVSFGTRGNGAARGSSEREVTKKEVTINVTNDLSNARIYGIDDLDNHIKEATKKTYYELNSPDGAVGY